MQDYYWLMHYNAYLKNNFEMYLIIHMYFNPILKLIF